MLGEVITELLHLLVVHTLQRDVGNLMEADEIETAIQTLHQFDDGLGMLHAVVHALEHDVLETQAALMREIVVLQQLHHLLDTHAPFGRHQFGTLRRNRVVHRNRHMALALFQESLQLVLHAHRTYRDALRAPRPTVIGGENLGGTKHIVEIIHRLALSHEHDVGELIYLWQRVNLVQDVTGRQTSLESLLSGLAEEAVHFAAHLRRDAERGAVLIRNIHRFHELSASGREEILDGTIHRMLCVRIFCASYFVFGSEFGTVGLRDVGHLINALYMLLIEPLRHLSAGEGRHAEILSHLLQFGKCKAQKIFFFIIHTAKIVFFAEKVLSLPHILR